jgi:PEP-CTERM motif-containing protein
MVRFRSFALFAIVVLGGLAVAPSAQADPLFFSNVVALQNNNTTRVELFSNPGTTLIGQQISFLVDITGTLPAGASDTLFITYTAAGSAPIVQNFQIPLFGTVQPPFTLLFTIPSTGATPSGTTATLTVDILGSSPDFVIPSGPTAGQRVNSFTYSFNVAQPVPEPATILFLGTGLFGLASRLRRRPRGALAKF